MNISIFFFMLVSEKQLRINSAFVTLMPRLDKNSLSSFFDSAAAARAMASKMLLFPQPFSPIKTFTRPKLISILSMDL
jgi:hypothetical protein